MRDKNGCHILPIYEGNVIDDSRNLEGDGNWHHIVTTMEQDIYGGTIKRIYCDGKLTDLNRSISGTYP